MEGLLPSPSQGSLHYCQKRVNKLMLLGKKKKKKKKKFNDAALDFFVFLGEVLALSEALVFLFPSVAGDFLRCAGISNVVKH